MGLATLAVSAGEHIGHFYRSKDEAKQLYLSFMKEGLLKGDTCICRPGPDFTEEQILNALESFEIDVKESLECSRLFLEKDSSISFYAHLKSIMEQIETDVVLRWVGDVTSGVNGSGSPASFHLSCLERFPAVILCQYDLTRLSGSSLMDAQMRHPVWIINDTVHRNPLHQHLTAHAQGLDDRYRLLIEINDVESTLDRVSYFSEVVKILLKAFPYSTVELALYDPHENVFHILAGSDDAQDSTVPQKIIPAEDSLQLSVLKSKQARIFSDTLEEVPYSYQSTHVRSAILVPVCRNGTVLGILSVGNKAAQQYLNEDMDFLGEIARQMALPVENILAHEEIARLRARLDYEHLYLKEEIHVERQFKNIVGQSLGIRRVLKAVETVAPTDAGVLLYGETGTGKELVVSSIQELSSRRDKPLVKINCAALPSGLMESELFGHEKGSFTGAFSRKLGRFEMADGGTIFLDEIGDLQLDLQAKLLRVLQEGEFERVGGHQNIRVDVRVIAATNQDLEKAIHKGTFRADLYYRLNVFPIRIPPLRERKEDIPLLVKYFVMKYGARFRKNIERIPQPTVDALLAYSWPGNIRELENLIERAVILCQTSQLEPGKWLPQPCTVAGESRIPTLEELEREHILEVLQMTSWRVSGERGAAKLLGMKATTLEARMKKLGITRF